MFSSATKSAAAAGGYTLSKSLRFRRSASAYLSKTYITTRTSDKLLTISMWVKRGSLTYTVGVAQLLMAGYDGSSTRGAQFAFMEGSPYTDELLFETGGSTAIRIASSQVFRDPAAWYHLVVVYDSTQATDTNRLKMYVNGTQVTSFSLAAYPAQNAAHQYIYPNGNNKIGSNYASSDNFFDGYISNMYVIDGQALTPSSFGSTNATTGVWQPARYTGTYGTNGFYLPFTNTTSTTTLGYDSSGNGNNWTTNNISLTAGATYDSMTDVPTLTSATVANYCVLNPLKVFAGGTDNLTLSNGNLTATDSSTSVRTSTATMSFPSTGKFYFECYMASVGATQSNMVGVIDSAQYNGNGSFEFYGAYRSNGAIYNLAQTAQTSGATYTTSDLIGIAVDITNGTVQFYKNNVAQGATPSFTFTAGTQLWAYVATDNTTGTKTYNLNFGQQPFTYTPPTGYVALNTYNLSTPTIAAGNKYMDATTYAGAGGTSTITNAASFKPDLVWVKSRTDGGSHVLQDSVRGVGSATKLSSNSTNAENNALADATDPIYGYLTAINSNGFTAYAGTVPSQVNKSGQNYVAWQWQANQGSTSSNTSGSITSTVSVSTTAGFSIVTWTATNSVVTVGHGLGAKPSIIITKQRSVAGDWAVITDIITGTPQYLYLNTTQAINNTGWGTNPTSSVFSGYSYPSGQTIVSYCWTPIAGFSQFGSYTGNGSTDGVFIYTGFRPKFVMIKDTSTSQSWGMFDSSRDTYNANYKLILPNSSSAEDTGSASIVSNDFLSNGFKLRGNWTGFNQSNDNYVYMAFAENPFKNALAR